MSFRAVMKPHMKNTEARIAKAARCVPDGAALVSIIFVSPCGCRLKRRTIQSMAPRPANAMIMPSGVRHVDQPAGLVAHGRQRRRCRKVRRSAWDTFGSACSRPIPAFSKKFAEVLSLFLMVGKYWDRLSKGRKSWHSHTVESGVGP